MLSERIARWTGRSGLIGLIAGAGMFGGCASQSKVDDQETTIRALQDQLARARSQDTELEQTIEEKNELLASARETERRLREEIDRVLAQNQELDDRIGQLEQRNRQTVRDFERILNEMDQTVLDPRTDRALAELASQHPDLVTYDADRGMLRFSSDLTFDSGSAVVRESAKNSLRELGEVLNGIAAAYEIDIVGHTDNQPIGAGTAQKHRTNLHLSAHRAISVRNVLAGIGVPGDRMKVSGWGAQRPLVPNNESGGTRQNRRVEIFLTRLSDAGTARAGVPETEGGVDLDRTPPPPEPDTTK